MTQKGLCLKVVLLVPHTAYPDVMFEVYNIYSGLVEPEESFDIIHTKNYDYLREFHRVLRPGGLLLIGELGHEAYEAYNTTIPATQSAPHTARGLAIVRQAVGAQGVMLDAIPNIARWLEPESVIWGRGVDERLDGSWHPDPVLQRVGAMAQEVWRDTWLSCVPLLMEHNLSREEVRGILEGAMRELCDPSVKTVWKYTMVTCFKI
ncbi:hypothetical protein BDV93DRAFT_516959 [Ceratobasidium sp. AG-I]|nr:hypothetical protein BDV93DRAFT_516959 [Ceratobasidium sp. AG-I]